MPKRPIKVHPSDEQFRRKIEVLVVRHALDRRHVYCVDQDGRLATLITFTTHCSGCICDCGDGYPCSHGAGGCRECGYTGKRVMNFAAPVVHETEIYVMARSDVLPVNGENQ